MKKIISAICGFTMIFSTALADETSVAIDLNKPIRWYEAAVRESLAYIVGLSGESSEYSVEQRAALFLSKSFKVAKGVVIASPAELITVCKFILDKKLLDDDKIPGVCAEMITEATRKHNAMATEASNAEQEWLPEAVAATNNGYEFKGLDINSPMGYSVFQFTNSLTDRMREFFSSKSYVVSEKRIYGHCLVVAADEARKVMDPNAFFAFMSTMNFTNGDLCRIYIDLLKQKQEEYLKYNLNTLPQINVL